MKQITELTDAELKARLETLKDLEETKELCEKIELELKSREEARNSVKCEKEKTLRRKQHDVIGKFYQIGDNYYKVVGVVFDRVILEGVVTCNAYGYEGSCKTYLTRTIDDLLKVGKETTEEAYCAHRINVNETINSLAKAVSDTFGNKDWLKTFKDFTETFNQNFGLRF